MGRWLEPCANEEAAWLVGIIMGAGKKLPGEF